jgi:hypothetical protein
VNLRSKVLVFGGVVGALLGVGAAYLYLRETGIEIEGEEAELPEIHPGDAIRVTLGILTAVRGIVGLGQPGA